MDETDYLSEDETDGAAGSPLAAGDPNAFLGIYRQNMAAMQRAARTEADLRRQMYEQARARIQQERFGVPTRSETLMQISQALLRPSKTHGFGASLGRVMPVIAQSMAAPRQAEEQRAAQLQQLQQQYLMQQATGAREAAAEQLGAAGKLAPFFKPQAEPQRRTGFNPVTGELVFMDTGESVENAQLPTLTPEQVAVMARDPRAKGRKFRTTDGRVMEIR